MDGIGHGSVVMAGLALVALVLEAVIARTSSGWGRGGLLGLVVAGLVGVAFLGGIGLMRSLAGSAAGLLFAGATVRFRFLDRSGAVAGGVLAASILAFGGLAWVVPGGVFFLTSSLLSWMEGPEGVCLEKGGRNARQVFANGGVAWLLLLLYTIDPRPLWYAGHVGAFAAAAADTWATEIGTRRGGPPRLLTTWRRVPSGTSGAVTLTGTLAALAGSLTVSLAAWPFFEGGGLLVFVLTLSGFLAALADSLLGATLQARFVDPGTGEVSETRGAGRSLHHGLGWLDNDRVNLLNTFVGASLAMACFPAG